MGNLFDELQVMRIALLEGGECSGLEMAALLGRWTWSCLVCRPALAVLSASYRFAQRADRRVFTIWPSVVRELELLIGLAPFLQAELDQEWHPDIVATDASSTGLGVVAAYLNQTSVREAALSLAATPQEAGALPGALRAERWRTIVSSRWRDEEHINVLELRAVSTGLHWVLSRPSSIRRKLLFLCDSQVVVGCLRKGRSSSPPLLRRLRLLTALQLASGTRLRVWWIRTQDNPADDASRQ